MKNNQTKTLRLIIFSVVILLASSATFATGSSSFWSGKTSEEYPPLTTPNKYLIDKMYCSNGWCDNIYLRNKRTYREFGHNFWSSFFSEAGTNYRTCPTNQFMTGISCKGGFCDKVSIQCTKLKNTTKDHCEWTPYFSEEQGYSQNFPAGKYAAGLRCQGSRCDNKSILVCHAH